MALNRATAASFEIRAALIVTGAYVYGNEFESDEANLLQIWVTKTLANNPTTVDYSIQVSPDAGVTWATLPQVNAVAAGLTTQEAMTLRTTEIGAAVGVYLYAVDIIPDMRYRVGVLATGALPTLAINCQLSKV